MNGLLQHLGLSLRLHFRNRMALLYGYLFPLIFLAVFWVLYRHDKIPLWRHMGELLTVSILGGACFGLPTTLVSERERGVWRRYRLTPATTWTLVASTVIARYFIIVSAGLLQLGVACSLGMPWPEHPVALAVAYTLAAFAFIGLGLVIAMLADNVPAVQALGQCIFLPMLIIGGVAVPLETLPVWAQHVSAFFPGRYAVEVLHQCVTGTGFSPVNFDLLALGVIGLTGFFAGAKLFRWDAQQQFSRQRGKAWLLPVVATWVAVGLAAEGRDRVVLPPKETPPVAATAAPPAPVVQLPPWAHLTEKDIAALDFNLPPDMGVVAPMAAADQEVDDWVRPQLENVRVMLPYWVPSKGPDDLTRVRHALYVAAIPDAAQVPTEPYVPAVVLNYLEQTYPKNDLVKMLTWIAQHPDEGNALLSTSDLGLKAAVHDPVLVKERVYYYAIKFVARLTQREY
jgi:ABC-type transport system involved in cytochrome c biogenesis permease component